MNLAQLTTAIQQYLECYETTFTDNIPVFLRNAEQRIYTKINLPATRKTVTGTLTIGVGTIDLVGLTDAYLAPISLSLTVNSAPAYLLNKELNYLTEMYPAATQGTPTLYAQVDETQLIVRPLPDAAYPFALNYYAKADSILDGTSWLGDNFDSVLMHGALVEGALFLKLGKDTVALHEAAFGEKMALLEILIDGKNQQDQYRKGTARVPVKG